LGPATRWRVDNKGGKMTEKGKLFVNKSVKIFVATGDQGSKCPRVNISKKATRFRDDYYGKLKVPKRIAHSIFL
jgi:hypothetical protein